MNPDSRQAGVGADVAWPAIAQNNLSEESSKLLDKLMAPYGIKNFTLLQVQRLCTGRTAHRGSRGIALLFLDHSTRRVWGFSVTPRPLFIPGKDPVPIVKGAGWAPGPVWTGAENLTPPGFDPWTVEPIASRYKDYAFRPPCDILKGKSWNKKDGNECNVIGYMCEELGMEGNKKRT